MALYNKYRPYKLSLICGQDHIKRILANQIKNNTLAHAYLFTGQAGVGKTSIARILAAMINCSQGMTVETSLEDPIVAKIISGKNNMDVCETDAATKGGIDNIREMRDRAYLSPMEMRKKVYIIDECHQLTPEAWNALLKIIEEPPPHAIFIFCTTDSKKVIETIKTRCQCFDFRPIPYDEILKYLRDIVISEKIDIEEEALRMIVRAARGSLRSALSRIEKISAFGENISSKIVAHTLGVTSRMVVSDFVNAILDTNLAAGIKASSEAMSIGVPPEDFLSHIAEFLHDLIMVEAPGFDMERMGCTSDELKNTIATRDKIAKVLEADFRKFLVKWIGITDEYSKMVVYRLQPQFLMNVVFTALYVEYKPFLKKANGKGEAAKSGT
jgi:DNA polymerase-3 subunit gamma/tau